MSDVVPDAMVFSVFGWFQDAMSRVGRRVSWPKCKDLKKTYSFRAIQSFIIKCREEFELDDRAMKLLVYDIAEYAKTNKLLDKGTQLLSMKIVVDICYHSLKSLIEHESLIVLELRHCHQFILDQLPDKNNLVRQMVEPMSEGGYSKLYYWYDVGHITPLYLALSRKCLKAIDQLSEHERSSMPSKHALFQLALQTVSADMVDKYKSIFGDDLREVKQLIRS